MEKIQITEEQTKKLIAYFKQRASVWVVFFIIGIVGLIPIGVTYFGDSGPVYYSSPCIVFLSLGIVFWAQSNEVIKQIGKNELQVYKTECRKITAFGSARVANNEILSKTVKKPDKSIEIVGSAKLLKAGEKVGILHAGKEFFAFPLD